MQCRYCGEYLDMIIQKGTVIMVQTIIYWCPKCGTLLTERNSKDRRDEEWSFPNEASKNVTKK